MRKHVFAVAAVVAAASAPVGVAGADEHVPPARAPVDLDDLAFEEARRLRSATALRVDSSAVGAARVEGDVEALRHVLRNLGDNAARHATSRINIALAERDGNVRLTIDDDGPGIPESERERVLKRFVRLDEARSRGDGGIGLNLSIVDEVVRAHGGWFVRPPTPRICPPSRAP